MQILTLDPNAPSKTPQPPALLAEAWAQNAESSVSVIRDFSDLGEVRAALDQAARVIHAQEDRIRQLEDMALTDELTGLFNRRGMMIALKRELAAARRDGNACGMLVMVDLDGFKSVNDQWGHAAGDDYLRAVADVLIDEVRASDVVARLGGDEFAILLTRIAEATGIERVGKLEQSFNNRMAGWNRKPIRLRGSFGFSPYASGDAIEAVMAAADLKLYAHKAHRAASIRKEVAAS